MHKFVLRRGNQIKMFTHEDQHVTQADFDDLCFRLELNGAKTLQMIRNQPDYTLFDALLDCLGERGFKVTNS